MACVAVFVREEERERERKGERRWAFVPGDCFLRRNCWRLCPVESTENGCATCTTAVVLATAPNAQRWFILSPLFCPHLVAAGLG